MFIRICIIFLLAALVVVILGRYKVETDLRDIRNAHHRLGAEIEAEQAKITEFALKTDVLESKQNLTELARTRTTLRPVDAAQLHNFEDFAEIAGLIQKTRKDTRQPRPDRNPHEFINHALAMAGYGA